MGDLGITHSWHEKETDNEFLFKFFIPVKEILPGPIQELVREDTSH